MMRKTVSLVLFLSIMLVTTHIVYGATAPEGCSPIPSYETFEVTNSSDYAKWYSITTNQTWLTAGCGQGFGDYCYLGPHQTGTVSVNYLTAGLAPGTYTGNVFVNSGSEAETRTFTVTVTLSNFIISPSSLTATSSEGCSPAAQTFTVTNSDSCQKYYSITTDQPWLTAVRTTGWGLNGVYLPPGQTGTVQVTYSTSGLAPGTYTGHINVTGGSVTKTVTATVTITPENTTVSPTSLTATSSEGCSPAAQAFTVTNSNTCQKYYSPITTDQTWLGAAHATGWGLNGVYLPPGQTGTVSVSYSTAGLTQGTYTGHIDVSVNGTPLKKRVTATLTKYGQTKPCAYSGPSGTEGVGVCKAGTQTCTNGQWGACQGEVLPTTEVCDGKDNNCNGAKDEDCDSKPAGEKGDPGICPL